MTMLSVASFGFNQFEGTLPASWSTLPLTLLFVEGNMRLYGSLPSSWQLAYVAVVLICETSVCGTPSDIGVAAFGCLPNTVVSADFDDQSTLLALMTFDVIGVPCPVETTSTISLGWDVVDDDAVDQVQLSPTITRSADATNVFSSIAAYAGILSGDSTDAQMLDSILSSRCMCDTVRAAMTSSTSIATSPFSPLDSAAAVALGNALLGAVCAAVHTIAVVVWSRNKQSSSPPSQRPASMLETVGSADVRQMLKFPNATVAVVMYLSVGVVRGFVESLRDDSSGSEIAIATIGLGIMVCSLVAVEVCVFRNVVQQAMQNGTFRFACYNTRDKQLFAPVPRDVAGVVLPEGIWLPQTLRASFGGLAAPWRIHFSRSWLVLPAINILTLILQSLPLTGSGCDAMQITTIAVSAIGAIYFVVAHPHRTLMLSITTSLGLVLTLTTSLLGVLCRHHVVSASNLLGFSTFASCLFVSFKVYSILVPFAERRLLQQRGGTNRALPTLETRELCVALKRMHPIRALREMITMIALHRSSKTLITTPAPLLHPLPQIRTMNRSVKRRVNTIL